MITVNDLGYLRAPEPEDLQWLYGVENDANQKIFSGCMV